MQKPSIPKGTRDFGPDEMVKRNYIFNSIQHVFGLYGYSPIETPAMENLSTLLGKYGEEGDKLLFKILNSGDFLAKTDAEEWNNLNANTLSTRICEKGLRYDLTVPFARFVVQHRNELTFPFKRYQIQPVWRADKPQKGRYREFFQCDVDVIGSNSLLNEVELIRIIDDVFNRLKINITIKINNRKILSGIAQVIGEGNKITDITVAIDKLEKIGKEGVNRELKERGVSDKAIEQLQPFMEIHGNNREILKKLETLLKGSDTGIKGVIELQIIFDYLDEMELNSEIQLDLNLARGLNYYTGAILEVKSKDVQIGSICGGGRYDDLTGIFGLPDVSGVGVSFGADRIFDVMNQLQLFPENLLAATKVFFVNFGEKEEKYCLNLITSLRNAGISAELYPEAAKLKKQMTYANNRGIKYVVIAGEDEIKENVVTVKNMLTGDQVKMKPDELSEMIKSEQ
jgi:histidyl-tRNA synthetase